MRKKLSKINEFLGNAPASQLLMSLGIALFFAAIALNINLYRVEAYFYDLRIRLKGSEAPHPDIVLLTLSDSDNHASMEAQAQVLKNLLTHKPKAIVYLNKFDPSEVDAHPAEAEAFVQLAQKGISQGINIYLGTDVDLSGEVLSPFPISLLPHAPAILHKDGTMFAEDRVMRRALLTVYDKPSIHYRTAFPERSKEQLLAGVGELGGAYFYEPANSWHMLIRYPENTAESSFPRIPFSEALRGEGAERAAGKIVLVETLRRDAMNDYAYTPYSRMIYTNPRLVVHASILDSLLKGRGILIAPRWVDGAITFLLALTLAFIAITMSPSRGVFALIVMSVCLFAISLVLFRLGIWISLVHPLLAMFFTYYIVVPYRAILEYKRRWEVQEKHDLLVEVEEMKGNFLSLMSHDLKTPVARIQGLAELVIRQGQLRPQQEAEMREIINSTESLDKFISKILNLTRVESNEIKLNKRSKDINKILEQCAKKLEFQAKQKGVDLTLDLDPLFPIQVDPALIIQVFTNLIDNSIKYSPPGSKVKIISREIGEFVQVVVEDNGMGMDEEETRQLFTKFFRGKSQIDEQNKGSGLGLYLSKYFIELHEGTVEAQSQPGSGSKFSIHLPIRGSSA